jgi:hypothetical protein
MYNLRFENLVMFNKRLHKRCWAVLNMPYPIIEKRLPISRATTRCVHWTMEVIQKS